MARATDKLKNFEANYDKLAAVVAAMEAPDLTLKESLDLYEKAVKLSETCGICKAESPGVGGYSC